MRSEHDIWQSRLESLQAKKEDIEKAIERMTNDSLMAPPDKRGIAEALVATEVQCPHCGKHFYI